MTPETPAAAVDAARPSEALYELLAKFADSVGAFDAPAPACPVPAHLRSSWEGTDAAIARVKGMWAAMQIILESTDDQSHEARWVMLEVLGREIDALEESHREGWVALGGNDHRVPAERATVLRGMMQ